MADIQPVTKPNGISKSVVQKWEKLVEGFQSQSFIKPSKKDAFSQMLENEMRVLPKVLKENVGSASWLTAAGANALGSVPFYIGVIRRGFPKLVGMNLFGVQPLTQPGGVLFTVRRQYKGKVDATGAGSAYLKSINARNSQILTVASGTAFSEGDPLVIGASGDTATNAYLAYKEGNNLLVVYTSGTKPSLTISSSTVAVAGGSGDQVISAIYDNFPMFTYIFKDFSKVYDSTMSAPYNEPGNAQFDGTQIREVGQDVTTTSITNIVNRRIKSKLSQEVIEDMQAFKYDIQNDLMNMMLEDITAELNREFFGLLKGSAEDRGTYTYDATSKSAFDNYVEVIGKATAMSNKIAVDLKNAVGNYMIITPTILSAFMTLSKYWSYSNDPSVGNIQLKTTEFGTDPMVGKFNGMWDLYVDVFADTVTGTAGGDTTKEEIVVGYYSENNMDNAWYYLPYIPLTPDVIKDPATGNWVLHYRTRYATLANPFGPEKWIKKMTVDNFAI